MKQKLFRMFLVKIAQVQKILKILSYTHILCKNCIDAKITQTIHRIIQKCTGSKMDKQDLFFYKRVLPRGKFYRGCAARHFLTYNIQKVVPIGGIEKWPG